MEEANICSPAIDDDGELDRSGAEVSLSLKMLATVLGIVCDLFGIAGAFRRSAVHKGSKTSLGSIWVYDDIKVVRPF